MNIKRLFLIDGAAGTGKSDLVEYIQERHSSDSCVINKWTTREKRGKDEEAVKTDLRFISDDEFQKKMEKPFYSYRYGKESYGFSKTDLLESLKQFDNTFVIIRSRPLIEQLCREFANKVEIITIFIHTDLDLVKKRLEAEGFSSEIIDKRIERASSVWEDYLIHHSKQSMRVILNNSDKKDFYATMESILNEKSLSVRDDNCLCITPSEKFELIKPLKGFKQDILEKLEKYPYYKNIFLMMKYRDKNAEFYEHIEKVLEKSGFNCVRADQTEWNITSNVFNPLAVLYCCKYGIALFDKPMDEDQHLYNPNVAYELGIMQSQKKPCLILIDEKISYRPFDLIKDLTEPYDSEIQFERLFGAWLKKNNIQSTEQDFA